VGIIREVKDDNVYNEKVEQQLAEVKASSKISCMDDLLRSGETWEIE
jgi:2-oxoglutarate ferredoxin oxidoreductase subunit beta